MIQNEECVSVSTYERIYNEILDLTFDADDFSVFENVTEETVEKCMWFLAMIETLNDVPLCKANAILKQKKLKFDCCSFLDNQYQ